MKRKLLSIQDDNLLSLTSTDPEVESSASEPSVVEFSPKISVAVDSKLSNLSDQKCSFTWPSAISLSRYFCSHPEVVCGKRILELGCGTGVPSIVALKLGAKKVILTDTETSFAARTIQLNDLISSENVKFLNYNWGSISPLLHDVGSIDLIIASDCFYESYQFELLIKTVAYLIKLNKDASFVFSYPLRDALKSLRWILKEYNLHGFLIHKDQVDSSEIFLCCVRRLK